MSKELATAILKSKTPEEWVSGHLIPKLELRESELKTEPEKEDEKSGQLESLGKGVIGSLVLMRENSPDKLAIRVFSIPRFHMGHTKGMVPKPKVEVEKTAFYNVSHEDFILASKAFGSKTHDHKAMASSTFEYLRFPKLLFSNPGWKDRVEFRDNRAFIAIKPSEFDLLSKLHAKISFLNGLKYTMISLLYQNAGEYSRRMRTLDADPYGEFIKKNRQHLGFIRKLGDILSTKATIPKRNQSEKMFEHKKREGENIVKKVRKALVGQLSLSPNLADSYSVIFADKWGPLSARAILKISRDMAKIKGAKS